MQQLGCTQFKAEVCTLPHQCLSRLNTSALNCVHPSCCICLNRAHMFFFCHFFFNFPFNIILLTKFQIWGNPQKSGNFEALSDERNTYWEAYRPEHGEQLVAGVLLQCVRQGGQLAELALWEIKHGYFKAHGFFVNCVIFLYICEPNIERKH